VYASHGQSTRTAARFAAVLFLLFGGFGANAESIDFPLLPAVESERAANSLLLEIASNGDRLLAVGEQGYALWSDDDGQNWSQAEVPVSLALTSVAFAGDGEAWATAHDGYLLHSADNGETWTVKLSGSDAASLSVGAIEAQVAALEEELEAASDDTREDVLWALDEATFALDEAVLAVDEGMTTPLLKVWFDGDLGYALGAYNVFLHTDDGGVTWEAHNNRLDNPEKYHLYGIARSAAGTLLVAGEAGTLLRSLDDGNTWESIESPYPGSFFGAVATADGSLMVFGLRGNVYRSTDEGMNWTPVRTGDNRTLMCAAASDDGTVVLAGSAGAVLISRDNGARFSDVPTEGNRVYSDVLIDADGRILLVGFGGVSFLTAERGND
jgi:photosystem II stability/assembly factor-like uncharacterized protein